MLSIGFRDCEAGTGRCVGRGATLENPRYLLTLDSAFSRVCVRSAVVNDDLYSLFPVWIAALFETNGQRAVGIGSFVASPTDGPPHTFDLNFSPQNDLLSVHVLGEDD